VVEIMFEIIVEEPKLAVIIVVAALIGLAFGINKFLKSKRHESGLLKTLALLTSIIIGLVNIMAIYEGFFEAAIPIDVHWLTVVLIFLAGMSMLADPLKETPLAAIIAMVTLGALAGLLLLFGDVSKGNVDLFGIITVPLWLVILGIVIIVGIVFLATIFTEFTVDKVLQIISWSPIIIIFNALLLIQGLLMIFLQDYAGIWSLLGG
jgi:hypothetical protein